MHNHTSTGIVIGGMFAAVITWIALSDSFDAGGFALLASTVFGLAAGLCIGALIASNFVMLDLEEREHAAAKEHSRSQAHAHA
jgi:hypothetical protein